MNESGECMVNRKKITLIVGAVFYLGILVLSITAKQIHIAMLPKVTVVNLGTKVFGDNANIALPKELYDNKTVYILTKEIVNGEERCIANEVTDLVLGQSDATDYEVIQGILFIDQVITSGQELLQNGCEVHVESE